jgi:squalene-hopene/tetraprenyl-beta-curcumene cyclase
MLSSIGPSPARAEYAITRAIAFLLAEAERQFSEVKHEMTFSHAAGFTGSSEKQSSDLFARATLANLFLDIADLLPSTATSALFRAIARREANYIAGAKVKDRAGGWSYFPDLPELPPDADSLAAALSLFVRIAPEYTELCRHPVELVLGDAHEDGSLETWIVASTDPQPQRNRMQWAILNCWGSSADPDVMASFYRALWLWAPDRYIDVICHGADKLIRMQQPNGAWQATWYVGLAYGTGLVARLLRELNMGESARMKAQRLLLGTQHDDGTWGEQSSVALQTALSVAALHELGVQADSVKMLCGAEVLIAQQLDDGSWPASPWIQMEIGRANGNVLRVATYQSTILTTTFCLRSLLLVNRQDPCLVPK